MEHTLIAFMAAALIVTPGPRASVTEDASSHSETSTAESASADQGENEAAPGSIDRVRYAAELSGKLTSPSLREASGLALSTRSQNLIWSHNDSGYGPYIFAFDLTGKDLGRFYLSSAGSGDWEDMAAFRWRDQSWLLVADTGDNSSKKTTYSLYLVAEPKVASNRSARRLQPLQGIRRARIAYPSGPADTEAVAVDAVEERVYLITKRERPAQVFSVPLSVFEDDKNVHMARFETELFSLPAPTLQEILDNPNLGLAFAQPNSMDFAPDRSFAIVHTYGYSYRFSRRDTQSWADAFAEAPQQFSVPPMKQSEAVAVGQDNRTLYYTSEGKSPPLYRLTPDIR